MESDNVVPFPGPDFPDRMDRTRRLIEHSRDLIEDKVMAAVGSMLEHVDDTLFELADRASNTIEQNLYFDAMREMRIKRGRIQTEFRYRLHELFLADLAGRDPRRQTVDEDDLETLSLIDEAELEESLAVTNAVNKLTGGCREALFALDRRMGYLLEDPDLEKHVNPFGPENICSAFRQACRLLEAGIEVRLIVFKLFEKYLVNALNDAYRETNRYLIAHDVLPEIKSGIRRAAATAAGARAEQKTDAEDVFAALQQLLSAQSGMLPPAGSQGSQGQARPGAGAAGTAPRQMVVTLTRLQQADPDALAAAGIAMPDTDLARQNLVRALQTAGAIMPADAVDARTIDIVAMMFDYILEDAAVPVPIRAELGRLQIPVLKAALLDRNLFSSRQHPLRQLLDRVSTVAVEWDAESMAELADTVHRIVERIAREFDDDVGLFGEALADFENYLAQQGEEPALRRERIARVLQGRDRIDAAKRQIRAAFAERMAGRGVPDFVATFLLRHWSEVLLRTYLDEGEQSLTWSQDLKLVDDLIASLRPCRSPEERRALIALLPRLLTRLKAGMNLIHLNEDRRRTFLARLAELHTRSVKAATAPAAVGSAAAPARPAVRAGPAIVDPGVDEVEVDSEAPTVPRPGHAAPEVPFRDVLLYDGRPGPAVNPPAAVAANEPRTTVIDDSLIGESLENYFNDNETVMTMLNTCELALEEIELIEETGLYPGASDSSSDGIEELDPAWAAAIDRVNRLVPGTWVELDEEDGGRPLRVCLHWVSESTDILNFTDRRGRVAVRKSVRGLALALQQRRARILDRAPLFERAVASVLRRCGRLAGGTGVPAPSG